MGKIDKETIRIAAEAGAKAAITQWEKERAKEQESRVDRRLHNTKLLLRNYRLFKKHAENAVFQAERSEGSVFDILDMMEQKSSNLFVDSIKNSAERTSLLVEHIDVMLGLYRTYCESSCKPEDARRWRVIKARYVDEKERSVLDIADQEGVADRTIRRDVEDACEHLAALFFGIDGVRKE